jgi:hypothetical protein
MSVSQADKDVENGRSHDRPRSLHFVAGVSAFQTQTVPMSDNATAFRRNLSYRGGRANVRRSLFGLLRALPEGSRTFVTIEGRLLGSNRLPPFWYETGCRSFGKDARAL